MRAEGTARRTTGVKPEDYYNVLERILAAPARVGIDLTQHFGAAERLHLS